MQLIRFNNLYQLGGIGWARSISARLQSLCPSYIVGALQVEKSAIALTGAQKHGVVNVALISIVVGTETFSTLVVIMIRPAPRPSVTLDTKMIVRPKRQFTFTCSRLEHTLCQSDAGRDAILNHLLHSNLSPLIEIIFVGPVTFKLCRGCSKC